MKIWETIKRFKLKQLFVLSKTLLKNPFYILPTYKATKETLKICDEKFGKSHHKNNKANAFRHALWNFLIAEKCFGRNNSVEKSINWTIKITDLHEKLSPNQTLAKTMDLHNNKIGRKLFQQKISKEKIIPALEKYMKNSLKISTEKEAQVNPSNLIYIENDER
ncbi:DUF6973 domain-containing protein [Mesonia maritima]|uniref:DUF6973 domain-containing protein n=1 Tax=Mesonia maritima TaxID=1793873 RepID=A0ABU1K247_9FLAO|nr:hypothetical protein [Mesonia maritima]MDR6299693.1 hypothetical protein [Mesonia maritima]